MLNHHEAANSEQRKRLESVTAEAAQDGMVGPAKGVVQNVFLMKVKTGKGRGTVKSPVFFGCESVSSSVRHEFISEKKLLMVDKLGRLSEFSFQIPVPRLVYSSYLGTTVNCVNPIRFNRNLAKKPPRG